MNLENIINSHFVSFIKPEEFFVSWNGVMTVAYEGFSSELLKLKKIINSSIPGLSTENPGSKWPKTTIGALNESKILNFNDLLKIKEICLKYKKKLNFLLKVDKLKFVFFQCRSLENRVLSKTMNFNEKNEIKQKDLQQQRELQYKKPPNDHLSFVKSILSCFSTNKNKLNEYLKKVQTEGNKINSYKKPFLESTLIFDLELNDNCFKVIKDFQNEIDENFPGYYEWFSRESLHMTIRAMK